MDTPIDMGRGSVPAHVATQACVVYILHLHMHVLMTECQSSWARMRDVRAACMCACASSHHDRMPLFVAECGCARCMHVRMRAGRQSSGGWNSLWRVVRFARCVRRVSFCLLGLCVTVTWSGLCATSRPRRCRLLRARRCTPTGNEVRAAAHRAVCARARASLPL